MKTNTPKYSKIKEDNHHGLKEIIRKNSEKDTEAKLKKPLYKFSVKLFPRQLIRHRS